MPERKSMKPIPRFEPEDEEREFWATHDSTEHVDWSLARPTTFSRLKPSTQTISSCLPETPSGFPHVRGEVAVIQGPDVDPPARVQGTLAMELLNDGEVPES
jgi:CopG antitoxin of type II toxin-antitoxin system